MGLLVSALLALATADDALPARVAHYGRQAEGWVRSRFVCQGMTEEQVRKALGHRPDCLASTFAGKTEDYYRLGVAVSYGPPDDFYDRHVTAVNWYFRAFDSRLIPSESR